MTGNSAAASATLGRLRQSIVFLLPLLLIGLFTILFILWNSVSNESHLLTHSSGYTSGRIGFNGDYINHPSCLNLSSHNISYGQPVAPFYERMHRRSIHVLQFPSPRLNFYLIVPPKSGNHNWNGLLYRLWKNKAPTSWDKDVKPQLKQWEISPRYQLLQEQEHSWLLVRNPYVRLLSVYLEKVQCRPPITSSSSSSSSQVGGFRSDAEDVLHMFKNYGNLTFEEFVISLTSHLLFDDNRPQPRNPQQFKDLWIRSGGSFWTKRADQSDIHVDYVSDEEFNRLRKGQQEEQEEVAANAAASLVVAAAVAVATVPATTTTTTATTATRKAMTATSSTNETLPAKAATTASKLTEAYPTTAAKATTTAAAATTATKLAATVSKTTTGPGTAVGTSAKAAAPAKQCRRSLRSTATVAAVNAQQQKKLNSRTKIFVDPNGADVAVRYWKNVTLPAKITTLSCIGRPRNVMQSLVDPTGRVRSQRLPSAAVVAPLERAGRLCSFDHHTCVQSAGLFKQQTGRTKVLRLEEQSAWYRQFTDCVGITAEDVVGEEWTMFAGKPCFYSPTDSCADALLAPEAAAASVMKLTRDGVHSKAAAEQLQQYYTPLAADLVFYLYEYDFITLGYNRWDGIAAHFAGI